MLAQWDAGSITAFVAKMNTTAKSLGMNHTTYTDPSGLEDTTVSSARDQLVIAMQAMALPGLRQHCGHAGGHVSSRRHRPELRLRHRPRRRHRDQDGLGLGRAGCWAFAATRTVAGTARTVYGVILGVPGTSLGLVEPTLDAGVALADAVPATVQAVSVVPAGAVVGHVDAPWRHVQVPVTAVRAVSGLAQAGSRVTLRFDLRRALPVSRSEKGSWWGTWWRLPGWCRHDPPGCRRLG